MTVNLRLARLPAKAGSTVLPTSLKCPAVKAILDFDCGALDNNLNLSTTCKHKMKSLSRFLFLLWIIWNGAVPEAPAAVPKGQAEHVVMVVWDGMRPDFIT